MGDSKISPAEEKFAQIYQDVQKVLGESGYKLEPAAIQVMGNTLLLQIQATCYWMVRALEAERKLNAFVARKRN